MKTLLIDACVRNASRTRRLAEAVLKQTGGEVLREDLASADFRPLTREALERRTALIREGDFSDPMFDAAKRFAAADCIVVAAPYWDLSFPSLLKIYIENIVVSGLTFRYNEQGVPESLCRAQRMVYACTAGGPVLGENEGFRYVSKVMRAFFGVEDARLIQAEMLDVFGSDPEAILADAIRSLQI